YRAKYQIKVTKRIEVAKVGTVGGNGFVIPLPQDLGSTKCVFDGLSEEPRECQAERFVSQKIQKPHGLLFHGVHKPDAIDELTFAGSQCIEETWQVFGSDGQICIADHQNVAACASETESDGVALTFASLLQQLARPFRMVRDRPLDRFVSVILR